MSAETARTPRRPILAMLLAIALWLLGAVVSLGGVLLGMVANCCGARDTSADGGPMAVGLLVGGALVCAGIGLLARWPAWLVATLAAAGPLLFAVGGQDSSDLAVVAPFAIGGWLVLLALLSLRPLQPWLASRS